MRPDPAIRPRRGSCFCVPGPPVGPQEPRRAPPRNHADAPRSRRAPPAAPGVCSNVPAEADAATPEAATGPETTGGERTACDDAPPCGPGLECVGGVCLQFCHGDVECGTGVCVPFPGGRIGFAMRLGAPPARRRTTRRPSRPTRRLPTRRRTRRRTRRSRSHRTPHRPTRPRPTRPPRLSPSPRRPPSPTRRPSPSRRPSPTRRLRPTAVTPPPARTSRWAAPCPASGGPRRASPAGPPWISTSSGSTATPRGTATACWRSSWARAGAAPAWSTTPSSPGWPRASRRRAVCSCSSRSRTPATAPPTARPPRASWPAPTATAPACASEMPTRNRTPWPSARPRSCGVIPRRSSCAAATCR